MSSYRRLVIDVPGDFSTLRDDEVQFPELLENEVLVKMEYSTVNPSDYYLAMGGYPGTFPPVSLGIEGSGTVTQAGSSEYAQSLINTRVAVRGRGSWGEYMKLDSDYVFPPSRLYPLRPSEQPGREPDDSGLLHRHNPKIEPQGRDPKRCSFVFRQNVHQMVQPKLSLHN